MTTIIMETARPCADRIDLSEQVITAWETKSEGHAGDPNDDLAIIANEVAILRRLASDRPSDAGRAGRLVERYQAMANRLRAETR